MRKSGILMHVTSLPSPYGIGSMGKCAYEQISKLWNAKSAVERLLALSSALLKNCDLPEYKDGPCSKAMLYKQA